MAGTPRKRRRRMVPAVTSGDGFSGLPDDVVRRIVSHLKARQAVRTCVLARRWRNLWRSVPRINADFHEFEHESETEAGVAVLFKNFVNRLLERRDPVAVLDEFWLQYPLLDVNDTAAASADANRWISHALEKKARSVEVVVLVCPLELDHTVFTSRYLRRLGLSGVCLYRGFFEQVNRGCPALEDMFLDDAIILDQEISSQTLKALTIHASLFSYDYQTFISTPSLFYLSLTFPEGRAPLLQNMVSLETASISLAKLIVILSESVLRQFLNSLSGVRNLDIDFDYHGNELEIHKKFQWCPKFSYLANLTLGDRCLDANFCILTVFLQNSPILEKLSLKLPEHGPNASARIIGETKERSFTCEHLQIVEVICKEDDPLLNSVQDFLVTGGVTSAQIHIKRCSQIRHEEP